MNSGFYVLSDSFYMVSQKFSFEPLQGSNLGHHKLSFHSNHFIIEPAEANLQPYLDEIPKWTTGNNLTLNADKSTSTIFSLEGSQNNKKTKS